MLLYGTATVVILSEKIVLKIANWYVKFPLKELPLVPISNWFPISGFKIVFTNPDSEKPTEGQNLEEQNSEKNDKKKVEDNVKVTLKVHKQVKPCLKTGLVVNYGVNSKEVDASLHASKQVDNVRINAKVDTKNTLTYGFTHTKDDLTLGFTAENQLLNDATEQNDKIVVTNHWGKFNFGLSAEYNRI